MDTSGVASAASSAAAQQQQVQQPGNSQQPEQPAPPGDRQQDCLQCRMIGTGVCLAASAYLLVSNWAQPPVGRTHRAVMLGAAGGFLALGIARALI